MQICPGLRQDRFLKRSHLFLCLSHVRKDRKIPLIPQAPIFFLRSIDYFVFFNLLRKVPLLNKFSDMFESDWTISVFMLP